MMRFWLEALFKLTLDFDVCLQVDTGLDHLRVVLQLLRRHPGMIIQFGVFTFLPASYCRSTLLCSSGTNKSTKVKPGGDRISKLIIGRWAAPLQSQAY